MPPNYLYNGKTLQSLLNKLHSVQRIILFLDYDGTLVPIKRLPALAVISDDNRKLLENILTKKNISLVIVTGREHSDINRHLRLKNLRMISNHGLQIKFKNKIWVHTHVKKLIPRMQNISRRLKRLSKTIPSLLIENKKYTVTAHYRNVPKKFVGKVRDFVEETAEQNYPFVKITRGKKVLEIRPNIEWNKGLAVKKVVGNMSDNSISVYIGDDTTDEDAFKVLKKNSITIKVGTNPRTHAKYFVRNSKQVIQFLGLLTVRNKKGILDG